MTTQFPIDAINTLLDMVRGIKPFDLVTAVKAALQIAEYVTTLFPAKSLAKAEAIRRHSWTLETALAQAAGPHTDSVIGASLLYFILEEVFKWIAGKVQQ